MAFKINSEVLAVKIKSAKDSYENILTALTSAQTALTNALNAVGGANTDIGVALNSVMGTYTEEQYTKANAVIDAMATSVNTVKSTYETANDNMVGFINKLKSEQDGSAQ